MSKITEITIKLTEEKEIKISLDEARDLYWELKELFDKPIPFYPYISPYFINPGTPVTYKITCA